MSSAADHQTYLQNRINPVLEALITQVLLERPEDPVPFMIKWLCDQSRIAMPSSGNGTNSEESNRLKEEITHLKAYIKELEGKAGVTAEENDEEDDDDDEDETVEELPEKGPPRGFSGKARQSVSAEAYGKWNKKKDFTPPVFPKTDEQKKRIKAVLDNSFLFMTLDDKDLQTVIGAMQEVILPPKQRIIEQGDDGDCLYVVESGLVDCYRKINGQDKLVKTCNAGDAFGELALLYNTPRAASVESRDQCVLWKLDRETFNAIVKDAASKKRQLYENFLKSVPLLESMDAYERSKISDALKTEMFTEGHVIVRQGDPGDKFYIVEEGRCVALKSFVPGQTPKEVMNYKQGDYFGELALLKNEPRAASIVAQGTVKVAWLDRRSFKRLLGPLEDILKRQAQKYN